MDEGIKILSPILLLFTYDIGITFIISESDITKASELFKSIIFANIMHLHKSIIY
ncbi:hypothetical protein CLTHE_23070 [Clostridium thermobutyricum DSM 4928]|uniref:Uncharacterized protein n=1 Tax=Clostridium thermobutyricum DSM 4928 TaxID=1121339 RepID=A0A1V4ST59_9CLOT|nr:hypothetical protein CLTHE_23070 [Clostridium thermobutyricum DSM 4928]